ncbi:GreA/GreB family elongation factor [Desulfomicrobium apsheronum]|uniref:GreA/GreB family elongation factor n=1 Tax=Desulfomicrobium apsheronum TaxID=52560 RepID=A0A1I3S621_9BACT|nr:nucleoside diphosphate kinase regulator [Desulfomicrobium apsheronum]SFJ54244.1 GreA/GreB family elongation factor [Desulfomicrobium apsheronum]
MNRKPSITITSLDAERLEILLDSLPKGGFAGKADLEDELDRAIIVDPKNVPPNVVTMNSTVKFKLMPAGEEFCLTLVYPGSSGPADAPGSTISILAPVGSALLGLSIGDEIQWPRPGGGILQVRIEEIVFQPERAGEFDL